MSFNASLIQGPEDSQYIQYPKHESMISVVSVSHIFICSVCSVFGFSCFGIGPSEVHGCPLALQRECSVDGGPSGGSVSQIGTSCFNVLELVTQICYVSGS